MAESRRRIALCVCLASACAALPWPSFGADSRPTPRAGDDFDKYANATWRAETTLPPGTQSLGETTILAAKTAARVQSLIDEAVLARPAAAGASLQSGLKQKVGGFYTSMIDGRTIERVGISPLRGELDEIAALADRRALSAWLGRELRLDDGTNTTTDGIFGLWVHQGFDEADRYLPHLVQGGLGLADREAYLDPSKSEERLRYRAHVAHILGLAGFADPNAATAVLALETAIARSHASRADTDDPVKTNNHWSAADFAVKAPGLDWGAYFRAAGLEDQKEFIVWQPNAVRGIASLVAEQPIAAWQAYLTFHLLDHYSATLPDSFARLGEQRNGDRLKLAITATNAALGEAIGRLYVERYFPPRAKAAAAAMAENLRRAFRARISRLAWMSPPTRAKALRKLAALKIGVGYPDRWTDYTSLRIDRNDAYGNVRRSERFAFQQALAKLGRPVDPGEWSALVPQIPGAVIYFSPNSMQFAAGILQPPYFDPDGDAASNYGSAGAGMAHEISHSFDLLGNLYDSRGRFSAWWAPSDVVRYRAELAALARQFSAYCPRPKLCLDGQRVLNENVADLAGLRVALDAYHLSLGGRPDRVVGGLSGDQRFFLAFARRWRKVQTDAALRRDVETDIHAPGTYRSNTVRNVDEWYRAFGVRSSDGLYLSPAKRIRIW